MDEELDRFRQLSSCLFRTVTCSFSEYKIYPGHGGMFIRKDGQVKEAVNLSFLARAFPQQQGLLSERAEEEARPH